MLVSQSFLTFSFGVFKNWPGEISTGLPSNIPVVVRVFKDYACPFVPFLKKTSMTHLFKSHRR
jgi:protein-disulfide isomerase